MRPAAGVHRRTSSVDSIPTKLTLISRSHQLFLHRLTDFLCISCPKEHPTRFTPTGRSHLLSSRELCDSLCLRCPTVSA